MAILGSSSGNSTFTSLMEYVRNMEDYTSMSLTQYAKKSMINSRVFIQRECAEIEALSDCLRIGMNLYTGLILTTVNMNQKVSASRTARDIMQIVSTENLRNTPDMTWDSLNRLMLGDDNHLRLSELLPSLAIGNEFMEDQVASMSSSKYIEVPKEVDIPSGRIIEVKFGDPKTNNALTVNLFLQLTPIFIPSVVAEAFVNLNFTPSIKQRFIQMSTGEISFWKDFIMAQDLCKKRSKARRQDRSGTLNEMIERQQNALSNAWLKLSTYYKDKQNIANSILIFEKNTFERACNQAGLNFNLASSRKRFFDKTFSMMIMVLDPNYQKVETYFHSLDTRGEYTFAQLKAAAKNDKYDLTDVMKAYGSGMAPKF